jgi:hypothetical protein
MLDVVLRSGDALGQAAYDLLSTAVDEFAKLGSLPDSLTKLFECRKEGHPKIPGAIACYGTECPLCLREDSSNNSCVFLPCGKRSSNSRKRHAHATGHPFCEPHINKWLRDEGKRGCPVCRRDVPRYHEGSWFKGAYILGWPRKCQEGKSAS